MNVLVREISSGIAACELTHLARTPIDLELARVQHASYISALEGLGCGVTVVPGDPELPDCVFIEDTAVVVPELAVMSRPGAESRRGELVAVESALRALRPIARIEAPGTLDGGDVLRIGRRIWVGCGARTNQAGAAGLAKLLEPHGYDVIVADSRGCLHFKSGCSQAGPDQVLLNPDWIDPGLFPDLEVIEVDPEEPFAANVLLVGDRLIVDSNFERTNRRLEAAGCRLETVGNSELAKAEGGLTCGSILLH